MACLCETKVNLKRVEIFCRIFVANFVANGGGSFTKSRLKVCSYGDKGDTKITYPFSHWLFYIAFILAISSRSLAASSNSRFFAAASICFFSSFIMDSRSLLGIFVPFLRPLS